MARPREPIDLIIAKGKKNLTKAEIEARRATEVTPCADDMTPPSYLTAVQKKRFKKIAGQLEKLKIMGETDMDTLARYVAAQAIYEELTKELRNLIKDKPVKPADEDAEALDKYYLRVDVWSSAQSSIAAQQDRYFKQAQAAAASLGLTISSRCKLVAPIPPDDGMKVNKFSKFSGGAEK